MEKNPNKFHLHCPLNLEYFLLTSFKTSIKIYKIYIHMLGGGGVSEWRI